LPNLPFDPAAFGDVISERTFSFHHGKHHKTYVDTANKLAAEAGLSDAEPLEIVRRAKADAAHVKLYNNAAQAWNHDFYWRSLDPDGGRPDGALGKAIDQAFGGYDGFAKAFGEAAAGRFGSGWAWLTRAPTGAVEIVTTANADTPAAEGAVCLLVVDVWEHAYYLDHQNQRPAYVDALIGGRLNWRFAAENFGA
jgi:Fe-Mn family superoxide dismutase